MKVLLVASFAESIVLFRGMLISAFQASGYQVHVAAPSMSAASPLRLDLEARRVVVHEISLKRTGTNALVDMVLVWQLFRLMRRVRPDIVLGYTIKPVVFGSLAAWLARVPRRFALVTGLGFAFTGERRGPLIRTIRGLYGFALGRVHKVFFQNPDDEAMFKQDGILNPATPTVVVNGSGIDLDAYAASPLPGVPVRFLMIGRLLGDKGVREYVAAAKEVRALHADVRFGLVGWIDENPDAITPAELNGWIAEGHIAFHGRLEDVRPAIADCSVYVLPSYREGTPRSVLEAMAMGRPVITTDAPGCRETVEEGENGFLVPVRATGALAGAMLRFVERPDLIPRMGQRSRRIAEEKYDVHKVNEVMLQEMGINWRANSRVAEYVQ